MLTNTTQLITKARADNHILVLPLTMIQKTKLRTLTMMGSFYVVMMMYYYVFVTSFYHVYRYYGFLMTYMVVMSMKMMMMH